MAPSRRPVDDSIAAFIQSGVSILAASSGQDNLPTIVRALGCRVSSGRRKVTLLVPPYEPFLASVRESGRIAATFTRPSTHETIQLKAGNAREARRATGDSLLLETYADAFVAEVCPLGYTEALIRAMVWCDPRTVSPIVFDPDAAFQQTPGPRAGTPLS